MIKSNVNYYLLHMACYQCNQYINKLEFATYNEIIKPKGSIQLYWRAGSSFLLSKSKSVAVGRLDGSISKSIKLKFKNALDVHIRCVC